MQRIFRNQNFEELISDCFNIDYITDWKIVKINIYLFGVYRNLVTVKLLVKELIQENSATISIAAAIM